MMSSDQQMLAESRADDLMLRTATPRWYFGTQTAQREVLAGAERFTLPLLCLVGDADRVADPDVTADFVRRAGSADKTLKVYPSLRHELLREAGRETIFQDILDWVRARSGS
jgi:alpha-beta hydrolase superfamily lysophospholipase